MNNLKFILFIFCFGLQLKAQEKKHAVNLYLPAVQFRFQDDASQVQTLKTTSQLGIGLVISTDYYLGIEQSSFEEKTGNETLSIEEKTTDTNMVLGFNIYDLEIQSKNHFKIWLIGIYGQSRLDVETNLNNTKTNESVSEQAFGVGSLFQLSMKSFLFEFDLRWAQSKNYNPEAISISHLRFGYQIQY